MKDQNVFDVNACLLEQGVEMVTRYDMPLPLDTVTEMLRTVCGGGPVYACGHDSRSEYEEDQDFIADFISLSFPRCFDLLADMVIESGFPEGVAAWNEWYAGIMALKGGEPPAPGCYVYFDHQEGVVDEDFRFIYAISIDEVLERLGEGVKERLREREASDMRLARMLFALGCDEEY